MDESSGSLLDYEKLDAYRCAIDFLRVATAIARRLPRNETDLRNQLKRASTSIPLNIAEGCGKPTGADRARFNAVARGSAMECGSIIDVCLASGHLAAEDARTARELILRLVSMLSKMCRV